MKVSIIIFITIILSGIGSYYLWQKGIPQGWAKGKIINDVEKRLNGQLKIKSIHFKFPNQVILEKIKLTPDENLSTSIVQIKSIICNYNFAGVSKIVVIEPDIYLYRDKAGNWNLTSLFKPQPEKEKKLPTMPILIKNAKLSLKDEIFGTKTTLSKIYLSYFPQGPPPYFHIRMGHQIKVSGNIYDVSPLQASFKLKITKKDISCYAGFLKTQWANLLQGQVSGNLKGEINREINRDSSHFLLKMGTVPIYLDSGNLSINKGVIKLTHLTEPVTEITGNFSLTANHNLIANKLKFKFRDIDVTAQKFSLYQKNALFECVTSKFYLKELGDIFPYLSRLNLKSVLKFKGEIRNFLPPYPSPVGNRELPHSPLYLSGEVKLLNQTPTGYKFPIMAKFKYQDNGFDNISVVIAQKTQIKGRLDIGKELNLNAKFDKGNLMPLLALAGQKELKSGTVTGEVTVRGKRQDIKYEGNLKLEINEEPLFKELIAKLKGDKKSITFTSQLVQNKGKIDIQGKGIRENINQPFSLSLTGTLNECNIFNRDISAHISFDGNLSIRTKLIGGQLKAENIVIDKNPYPHWQGSLIYDHPTLNISTPPEIKQLAISGKITLTEPIAVSMQIKTKDTNIALLTKALNGTFDGKFNLISRAKTTISGESVKLNLADGRSLNGNFELTKIKNEIYIEHLVLNEPQISVRGKVDLSYPETTFVELEGNIDKLKYKNLNLNTNAKFKGYFSKSQVSGLINFTDGKFNNFIIDHGEVNFSYADQKFTIKESGIILDHGGILTTFGTFTTNGKIDLEFSLLGMDYQDMPYPYFKQFKGIFDLVGEIKGDIDNPIILASIESNRLTIANEKIARISGRISYSNNELRILQAEVTDKVSFKGTFKDEYLSGMIQLKGENLTTLTSILSLPSKNLQGIIKGQIETKGKLNNLTLKGAVEIKDFHIPGFDITYGEIKFTLEDNVLSFQKLLFVQVDGGRIDFKTYQLELKPDGKVTLIASMENFIMANIAFDGNVYFTGIGTPWNRIKGSLNAKNLLINQSDMFKKVAVDISYENGLLEFLPLPELNSLSGKIRFVSNEKLEIKDIKILKSKMEKLKINGDVELLEKRCDLRFVMDNSDLKILQLWFREIKKPEGKVDGWLQICGNFDEPQFNGALMVTNGALTTFPFAKRITELQGQIQIVNNRFVSNSMSVRIGKSILVMKSNGPWTLKNVDIILKSSHKPVPIKIPGLLEGGVEIDIQIKGNITELIGSGNIKIVNAMFTYPPPKIKTIGGSKIRWENLMITTDKNVRYYNEYVDVRIKRKGTWLNISGYQDEIWAEGIIYAQAGGSINYLGKNFTIKRAYLEFKERTTIPYLSGYAITRLDERRIALTYEGYLGEVTPVLQSFGGYPPMNEEQIVNTLLMGKTEYVNLTPTDTDTILKAGFRQVIGKEIAFTLLIPIEKQISSLLLGLDVALKTSALERMFEESLEKDTIEKPTSIFAESEFKVGKFISDNIYLSYRGILKPWEEEEFARLKLKQELELEYYISGNTAIKYKFTPEGVWRKGDEHEVIIERQVRF